MKELKQWIIQQIPPLLARPLEKVRKAVTASSRKSLRPPPPVSIVIDPVNRCNLRCPLCPTGLGRYRHESHMMSLDTFSLIIQKMPFIEHICLFNWGEPFLNPSIFGMIEYAKKKHIRVAIHSNFSMKMDTQFLQNILTSRLDTLVLSMDGASHETYSKYRVGGDFDLVIQNLKRLVRLKDELRSRYPVIKWKFVVNKYNEHEIAAAKAKARALGVVFEISYIGLGDDVPDFNMPDPIEVRMEKWLPIRKDFRHPYYRRVHTYPLFDRHCTQLFDTVAVNPDGKVMPCCWVTDPKHAFGDLTKQAFEDIWNNAQYTYSRSLFLKNGIQDGTLKTVCSSCNLYKKSH